MIYRSAPCDMVLAWFQIWEVLALHISITEAGGIIGVVGLTVQIDITVIGKDADGLVPDIHVASAGAIHTDQRL